MSGATFLISKCCCGGCYTSECEHCATGAPTDITITFDSVVISDCIQGEGGEFAFAAEGDFDAINGTFCISFRVDEACVWGDTPITEETLSIYYVPEFDTCEEVLATGTPDAVGIDIRRIDGKWVVWITAGDVPQAVIFYGEISTDDCRTGGTVSNQLTLGDGSIIMLDQGSGLEPFYEMGTGGSVTITPCC